MKPRVVFSAALACSAALYSASALPDPFISAIDLYGGWYDQRTVKLEQADAWWRTLVIKMTPAGEMLPFDRPTLAYRFPWHNAMYSTIARTHGGETTPASSAVTFILAKRPAVRP